VARSLTFSSQSQAQLPSSLQLQSSSTLGTGKASTHQQNLDKQEDKEVRHALGKRKRGKEDYDVVEEDSEEDGFEKSLDFYKTSQTTAEPPTSPFQVPSVFPIIGSALQRNSDGSIPAPKVKPRSLNKKVCNNCRAVLSLV